MRAYRFQISAILAAGLIAAGSTPARAVLTLTADGIADGFTLTTFLSGYSGFSGTYGPLAQGIAPDGKVITGSRIDDRIYVFKDVDNQTLASAVSATPYTFLTSNPQYAMTTAGGQVYGAQVQGSAPYEHFNNDGSHAPIPGLTATNNLGMWGNPVNGHIIASANQGLIDIDPVAGTFRVIVPNPGQADGVSVSPDGKTLYAAIDSTNIVAYDIASGTLLHTFSGNGHLPDGTGVISGGNFNGDIIVNNNDGTVGLIDPAVGTEDIIASGGTRGDFVSPDTSNGTLFISQLERVDRLICPMDSSCSGVPVPLPRLPWPASAALLAAAVFSLEGFRFWKRRGAPPNKRSAFYRYLKRVRSSGQAGRRSINKAS
jgi:WD40 repeat protein